MSGRIAIIVEGEARELRYWQAVEREFLKGCEFVFLPLPAGQNIYMLWKMLQKDPDDLDVIELLRVTSSKVEKLLEGFQRNDFQEIYLFFDYDRHQQNLSGTDLPSDEILHEMINTFDNETENGKLYISYPMCEALRDFVPGTCIPFSKCKITLDECKKYKQISGPGNSFASDKKYTLDTWMIILHVYLARVACLLDEHPQNPVEWYKKNVNPLRILLAEEGLFAQKETIFVLSAFPEFLLDYFPMSKFTDLADTIISREGCTWK